MPQQSDSGAVKKLRGVTYKHTHICKYLFCFSAMNSDKTMKSLVLHFLLWEKKENLIISVLHWNVNTLVIFSNTPTAKCFRVMGSVKHIFPGKILSNENGKI
ncbi:hypothetical protein AMECASPLE_026261 [Ameca splendens]|uniref:Uncharacterized protein n=1 Tax=Ameca splendens TaxID=208324 RepID=A0ABV0Y4R1_9TELE